MQIPFYFFLTFLTLVSLRSTTQGRRHSQESDRGGRPHQKVHEQDERHGEFVVLFLFSAYFFD